MHQHDSEEDSSIPSDLSYTENSDESPETESSEESSEDDNTIDEEKERKDVIKEIEDNANQEEGPNVFKKIVLMTVQDRHNWK